MHLRADDGAGHSGTSTVFDVQATLDLGVTLMAAPNPVQAGNNLLYVATIANYGPDKASHVVLSDPLPTNVTFVSVTLSQGSYVQDASGLTCSFGNLNSGGLALAIITVTPQIEMILTNTMTVSTSGTDTNQSNNSATAMTTVQGIAVLNVTPSNDLSSIGPTGGPFSPGQSGVHVDQQRHRQFELASDQHGQLGDRIARQRHVAARSPPPISLSPSPVQPTVSPPAATPTRLRSPTLPMAMARLREEFFSQSTTGRARREPCHRLRCDRLERRAFLATSQPYTVINTGGSPMDWLASASGWLSVSPSSGTLPAAAATTVTIAINANAGPLSPGTYNESVLFTNLTNGAGNTSRLFALLVNTLGLASSPLVNNGNGNGRVDPNECNVLFLPFRNDSDSTVRVVNATLSTSTPGMTIFHRSPCTRTSPPGQTATNLVPFQIETSPVFVCGSASNLVLTVSYITAACKRPCLISRPAPATHTQSVHPQVPWSVPQHCRHRQPLRRLHHCHYAAVPVHALRPELHECYRQFQRQSGVWQRQFEFRQRVSAAKQLRPDNLRALG